MWGAIRNKFLTWFGKLKYFRYPFFIVWDPGSYQLKGDDVRELLGMLQPGDILLRAYTHYVDGIFIPGQFSHVGIYVGDVNELQREQAGGLLHDADKRAAAQKLFKPGPQMVIHSMAEGVQMEDVLTFSRCDFMVVLRLPEWVKHSTEIDAALPVDVPEFKHGILSAREHAVLENLNQNSVVSRAEVIPPACDLALGLLGSEYDFGFDFKNFTAFSCSEFVYYCYRSVDHFLRLRPVSHRFMYFFKGVGIAPDDYLRTGLNGVWASRSAIANKKMKRLLNLHPEIFVHHAARSKA